MLYDDEMGGKVTEPWRGAEAARKMKPLFPKAKSLVEAQGQARDEHVLFSFRSPSNGLVGFEIQGFLSDNKLQLSVQMLLERIGAKSETSQCFAFIVLLLLRKELVTNVLNVDSSPVC